MIALCSILLTYPGHPVATIHQENPYSWEELHVVAQNDAEKFKETVWDYYENFPCDECKGHFRIMLAELEKFLPIQNIKTTNEAQTWAWLAHNSVNLRLKKEYFSLDCIRFAVKDEKNWRRMKKRRNLE